MVGGCGAACNGAGIRPSKALRSGRLGGITRGIDCGCSRVPPICPGKGDPGLELETCALAAMIGASASMTTTRTLVNGRMTNPSLAVPKHQYGALRGINPSPMACFSGYVGRNSAIPVNLTQFRPAGGQESLGSERDRIWRFAPSGPIPKFASARVTFRCELRNLRTTSNFMILVRF
jgi:hypothetical protein